jgi:hypothetical protein
MGERTGDLSCRESMSIGSGNGMTARRWFRAGLLKWCLGIFMAILLGLVQGIRAHAVGDVDVIDASMGPARVMRMVASNTLYPNGGVRFISSVQGTPATNRTTGTNAKKGEDGTRTRAAGPCAEKEKRYVDCGNGTVTDTVTGLIWLKQADCLSSANWEAAKKAVAGLKNGDCMLKDGSSPGDWRLPTNVEWEATMKNAKELGCAPGPDLTNDMGTACMSAGPSSFTGVESDYYWSSTALEGNERAWLGDLDHGNLLNAAVTSSLRVWPVRGGRR